MKTLLTAIKRFAPPAAALLFLVAAGVLIAEPGENMPASSSARPPVVRQWFAVDKLLPGRNDDAPRKLMIERYNAATEDLAKQNEQYDMGCVTIGQRNRAAVRVLQAAIAISDSPAEQIRIREQYLELMRQYEQHEAASGDKDDDKSFGKRDYSRYLRLDAEIRLMMAKQQLQSPAKSQIAPLRVTRRDWFAADEARPGENDGPLAKLMIERYNAATAGFAQQAAAYDAGTVMIGDRNLAIQRVRLAALMLNDQPSEQIKIREQEIELLRRFEQQETKLEQDAGRRVGHPTLMRAARLDAELQLAQAKGARLPEFRIVDRDLYKGLKLTAGAQSDPLGKLLVERYNAAVDYRDSDFFKYGHGIEFTVQEQVEAIDLVLHAALALNPSPSEHVKLRGQYLEYLGEQERKINAQFEAGLRDADAASLAYIRSLRLDAEVELLMAKRKLPAGKR